MIRLIDYLVVVNISLAGLEDKTTVDGWWWWRVRTKKWILVVVRVGGGWRLEMGHLVWKWNGHGTWDMGDEMIGL